MIFCCREGVALHGHQDDSKYLHDNLHANAGKFVALLNFAIESGGRILAEYLQPAGGNALYTSNKVQKQLIEVCGDII